MIAINFTGLNVSSIFVGMANVTDSLLYVRMIQTILDVQPWLLILTAVLLAWFLYTRNLILAIATMMMLALNMYVFGLTDYDDTTKLILRCVCIILIAFVLAYQLYDSRKRAHYGH